MECAPYLIEERKSLKLPITRCLTNNLPDMKKIFKLIQLPHYNVLYIDIYPSAMSFVGLWSGFM